MEKRKLCFIFINPEVKEEPREMVMDFEGAEMHVIAVGSYDMAASEAKRLADNGFKNLEFCPAFGNIGIGKIQEAVRGKANVGVVRFDLHPGYDHESGDGRWL